MARNSTTRAISSGSPWRPERAALLKDGDDVGGGAHVVAAQAGGRLLAPPSVRMAPGATAFTRIPNGASSRANALVIMATAPFDTT